MRTGTWTFAANSKWAGNLPMIYYTIQAGTNAANGGDIAFSNLTLTVSVGEPTSHLTCQFSLGCPVYARVHASVCVCALTCLPGLMPGAVRC